MNTVKKKITISKLFPDRLKSLIKKELKISQEEFAETVGIAPNYLSMILTKKSGPSAQLIAGLFLHYSEYLPWLLSEGDDVYNKDRKTDLVAEGDDPALAGDLALARKILMSGTPYGPALHFNILQFNAGLEAEKKAAEVDQLQRDVAELKAQFSAIEREKSEKEARIRAGDPPDQKEEFLRKRGGLSP